MLCVCVCVCVCVNVCGGVFCGVVAGVCVCAMSSKTAQRRTHTHPHTHTKTTQHTPYHTHTHSHTVHKKDAPLSPARMDAETTEKVVYFVFSGHLVLGLASGLEAFSREPPCDGFGALAVRQTPETRGTAWEFLSYYPILPSRYLRDPFTISLYMYTHTALCMVMSVPSTTHRSPGPRTTRRPLCTDNLFLAISS